MMSSHSEPVAVDGVEVDAAVRRVQAIDPDVTREAVERYLREIAEMADALRAAGIDGVPTSSSYSPDWEGSATS